MVDYDGWPKPSEEELPDLYEDIGEMIARITDVLEAHFDIERREYDDVIRFGVAIEQDYLRAIDADNEVMVPFFQKIAGLPDREFECQYGEAGLGSRLAGRKSSVEDVGIAELFAEALAELMPETLSMEAAIYTFFKTWEGDQRRFYRMRYESAVQEFLEEAGFPNFKGNTLPGEPDLVLPTEPPYEVIGEVRVIQQKDREKRFKEFRSEAAEAAENFPDARFVAVANMGAYIEHLDDREWLRDRITKEGASEIDAVFFHDEREEMIARFEGWGVTRE